MRSGSCFLSPHQRVKAWTQQQNSTTNLENKIEDSVIRSLCVPHRESQAVNTLCEQCSYSKKGRYPFGDDPHRGIMILPSSHRHKQWGRPGENHGVGKHNTFTNGAASSTAVAESQFSNKVFTGFPVFIKLFAYVHVHHNMDISKSFIYRTICPM